MHMFRKSATAALVLIWILTGCSAFQKTTDQEPAEVAETPAPHPPPEVPAEKKPVMAPEPEPPGDRVFKVAGKDSLVEIYAYRKGRLAHLGHNHVISSRDLQGSVTVAPRVEGSRLDLQLPVATLVVDDPALRKAAGKDFETQLSESDIEGTRTNMLSTKVLDAKRFPRIRVQAKVVGGALPVLQLDASLRVLGMSHSQRIPVKVEMRENQLTASGIFDVRQSDFDMKPFSTLVGALTVKDKLTIRFNVVARETAPP